MRGCSFGFKLGCDLAVPFLCTNGVCGSDRFKLGSNQIRSDLAALMWDRAWTKEQSNGDFIHIILSGSYKVFLPLCVAAEHNPWPGECPFQAAFACIIVSIVVPKIRVFLLSPQR